MNKKIVFSIILALILGSVSFFEIQKLYTKNVENPYSSSISVLRNGEYLDDFFPDDYYNEEEPTKPFVQLNEGSEFLFRFNSRDSTLFYRILEDSPSTSAMVSAEVYEININYDNDTIFDALLKAQKIVQIVGEGKTTELSKQELTEAANHCDLKLGSVVTKEVFSDTRFSYWSYVSFKGFLGLILCSFFIWWLRRFSDFFGGLFGFSEVPILSFFVFCLLFALPFSAFGRYLISILPSVESIWDVFLSIYGIYRFVPVALFLLFRYLISKYKTAYDFVDLEVGKFVFIVVLWMLFFLLDNTFLLTRRP